MHKTKLTQDMKAKHISNAKKKKKIEGERENKWQNHLEPFSFHTLEEPFRWANSWSGGGGEEFKPFKFESNIRALKRSLRGAKEDGNWFWFPNAIMLLLYWVANHLYQLGRVCLATPQWWQKCCFFYLGFWVFPFLALGFLISFLSCLGGAPKIDLPCLFSHYLIHF